LVEYRRLQLSAMGSYLVTLPRQWVESLGLRKGSRLRLSLDDRRISIYPEASSSLPRRSSHTIYIEDFPNRKFLELCINASYIQGNDVTEVLSKDKLKSEHRKWVREALDTVIGAEIAEEFSDRIVLQSLVDPLKFHIDAVTQRFSAVAMAVYTDAVKALFMRDKDFALDAVERGKESAKLYRLLMRQVIQCARSPDLAARMNLSEPGEIIVRALTVRELSRIAYYATRIAEHTAEVAETDLDEMILRIISEAHAAAMSLHRDGMQAIQEKNLQLASKVIDDMENLRAIFDKGFNYILSLAGKLQPDAARHLLFILRNFRAIGGYAVGLADNATLRIFSGGHVEAATPAGSS